VKVDSTGFSDSYVMSLTLSNEHEHLAMRSLLTMVLACASAALLQLASGRRNLRDSLPVRGGIDVGPGIKSNGDLFSSATAKVAVLEKKADFPRILVGDDFRRMLSSYVHRSSPDATGQIQASIATRVGALLYQDADDGLWAVDFLGEAFRDLAAGRLPRDVIEGVWRFVQACQDHFKHDKKLGPRYNRLARYVSERLQVWGVSP